MANLYSNNDEIIIDLTRRKYSSSDTVSKIKIIDVSYNVPVIKGLTKRTYLMGNYRVNLHYLQCTCPVYKNALKIYPKRDIRRICKHLYYKIITELESEIDTLSKMLLDNKFWLNEREVFKIKLDEHLLYLGFDHTFDTINIYRFTGRWKQYRFSFFKRAWINEIKPFHNPNMTLALEQFIDEIKAVEQRKEIISNFNTAR
jgi:hypothetical protein